MRETDLHHLWWTRAEHNKTSIHKALRNHPLSKQEMSIPWHRELHVHIRPITPVQPRIAKIALNMLNDLPAHYTALDASKSLYEELYDTEAHEVAEHLGRQIPFFELSQKALRKRRV